MVEVEIQKVNAKKLSQGTYQLTREKQHHKKLGKLRRLAEPHITARKRKGRLYYWYRHGEDIEIYLGDADAILKAIIAQKSHKK